MGPAELQMALGRGEPAGAYVLTASDPSSFDTHIADTCLDAVVQAVVPPEERDTGVFVFDGDDFDLGGFLAACQTLPMFGSRSVSVCRRVDRLSAEAQDVLQDVLTDPLDACVIVLIAAKLDGRAKFSKFLKKHTTWVDVSTPTEPDQLAAWVEKRVREDGKQIDPRLARELALKAKRQDALRQQLEQIVLFAGEEMEVTRAAVQALWRAEPEDNVFAITDALSRRDTSAALHALADAERAGAHHLQLIALIESAVRRLVGIRQGMDAGLGNDAIAAQLGIKPGAVYHQRQNAGRWDISSLRALHRAILATEFATKTGGGEPHLRLERFLVEACR